MTAPSAIRDFCGYGTLEADLWLIGLEESTGERPLRPAWSFEFETSVRETWTTVMDVRTACDQLLDRYWLSNGYSTVWKYMAKLARGLLGAAHDWNDMASARAYVVAALGRTSGDTLLGELLPLPAPHTSDWPTRYRHWYRDREEYGAAEYPRRQRMWRDLIQTHRPKYVCCYGNGNNNEQWTRYRSLFDAADWKPLASGRVQTAKCGPTTAYLLPFLGQGQLRLTDLHAVISDAHPALLATRPAGVPAKSSTRSVPGIPLEMFEQVIDGLELERRVLKQFTKFWGPAGENGPGFYLQVRRGHVTRVDLSRVHPPSHHAVCGPRVPNGQVTAELDFAQSEEAVLEAFALFAERIATRA